MKTEGTIPLRRMATAILCAAGILLGSHAPSAQEAVVVARDAWVRRPAPSKDEMALYLVIENRSAQRRALVGVSSEVADKAEMHQMTMEKTVMRMTPVAQIAIPAKGKVDLNPNKFHIMLFGLKSRPAVGDMLTFTLKLDDGTTVPVSATVRK